MHQRSFPFILGHFVSLQSAGESAMVTVSAGWPGERRELSRFATALVSMLGEATTQAR